MKRLRRSTFFSFILILAVFCLLSTSNAVHAVEVTATVLVGNSPAGVAYDSGKGEIFVANYHSNTISVISESSNTVVASVSVGFEPVGLAYDFGKGEIFVTNNGAGTVSVVSDSNNTVVATVTVGTNPEGAAYDSVKGEIFVANWGSDTVSVISDSNNTVVVTVPVGSRPIGVAYDSAKGEIFVANSDSSGKGTVSVISETTNAVVANVTVGGNPGNLAYNSSKDDIIVVNSGDSTVSFISDSNNTVVTNLGWTENETIGNFLSGIASDSDKGLIFFGGESIIDTPAGTQLDNATVWVMSDNSNTIVETVTLPTRSSSGIAYDSVMSEIFIANGGAVSVISDSSLPSTSPTTSTTPSSSVGPTTTPSPSIPEFPVWCALPLEIVMVLTAVFARKENHKHALRQGFTCV